MTSTSNLKPISISNVRFTAASPEDAVGGLLGYVSATLNESLALDGLTLRRTADGRLTISFPARRDSTGRQRFFLRPLDDAARREIEVQVFRALGFTSAAP
jgi:DNA-binding cell septation regulator SpoVG